MIWNLVRRWVLLAVAVPVAAAGARKLSRTIEARRGPSSRTARLLRGSADTLQNLRRGSRRRRRWS